MVTYYGFVFMYKDIKFVSITYMSYNTAVPVEPTQ